MKKIWTHCHICGRGIREGNPGSDYSFKSSLIPDPSENFYGSLVVGYYQLETRVNDSRSYFFLCSRCKEKFEDGFRRFIRRLEKKFGSKKRWIQSPAESGKGR